MEETPVLPNVRESLTDCRVKLQSLYDSLTSVKNQFSSDKFFDGKEKEIPGMKEDIDSLLKTTEFIKSDLLVLVSKCNATKDKKSSNRYLPSDNVLATLAEDLKENPYSSTSDEKKSVSEEKVKQSQEQLKPLDNSTPSQDIDSETISGWDIKFMKLRTNDFSEDLLESAAQLQDHFLFAAATVSKMIIGEKHIIDVRKKKIQPSEVHGGVAGGTKFLVHNLFFKYPVDTNLGQSWLYGGIEQNNIYAGKAANHDLNGITYCMEADEENKINYPLSGLIEYQGFRLTVMTHLPISKERNTLVYGSDDAGDTLHTDKEVHEILAKIGSNLNLTEHYVIDSSDQKMALCGDIEIHRLKHLEKENLEKENLEKKNLEKEYLFGLDLARVFPPVEPLKGAPWGSIFFRLLRPELVKKMNERINRGLCSDALSKWLRSDQTQMNADIKIASQFLLEQVDNFAKELSNNKLNNRFVDKAFEIAKQPSFNGIPFKDTIIRELHKRGINMRYIGLLAIKMDEKNEEMKNFLISLMITRAMKNMWRKKIQKQQTERVYETCLYQTLDILNSFVNYMNHDSTQEEQENIFWKKICKYMVDMFEKGLTDDHGKLKELLGTAKNNLKKSWIIVRFCQLCGVELTPNAIQSLYGEFFFQFSRADILDFVVNIKCPPILHYFAGIHYFKMAEKEKIFGTKLSLMKATSERLLNALDYNFPSVRKYYAKSQFFSQKFDRKFVGDWYEIKQYYDQKWKQFSDNNVKADITQKYLDCLCFTLWPVFLQKNSEYTQIELNELRPSDDETINNLKSILSKTQIVEIIHCISSFEKMKGAIDKKIEDSIKGLTKTKIILSDNNPLIKNFIEEIMNWDIEIDRKWWFFENYFSSSKDVIKFCHHKGIKLKDRNSEEFPVLPYPHLLSLFYYGDMELEQMLDEINVSDLKLTEILSIVNEVDGPNLAVAKKIGYKDVVDLLIKRGVKLNIPVVICDSLEKIIKNLEDFNKEKSTMQITSMRELNFSNIKIGDGTLAIGEEGAHSLSSALMSNNTVVSLNLFRNRIGDKGANSLSSALKSNKTLTSLIFQNNGIGEEGANSLSSALESNNTLTSLDLRDNAIGDKGANSLSSALKSNHSLTSLVISSNKILAEGAKSLSYALKSNNTLTFLDLSFNAIGDEGAISLSSALESNNTLTSLNISNNKILAEGANCLSYALKSNKTLTFLELTCNKIGDEGAISISSALKLNNTLTSLNFSINAIGDEGAISISSALMINKTLTSLNIKSNKIGDEGAISISSALKLNNTLTSLNFSSNKIGKEVVNSLKSAPRANNTLEFHI